MKYIILLPTLSQEISASHILSFKLSQILEWKEIGIIFLIFRVHLLFET